MNIRTLRLAALVTTAVFSQAAVLQVAIAADTPADSPPQKTATAAADKLAPARALIAAKQWPAAIEALARINDTGSADWHNLMGYSLRKGKTPDLVASERHYDEALRIDPKHLGTLEYSGELYLMKGDLDKAQGRLARLAAACDSQCEPYKDLKAAIDRYQAAGNKFVATTW
jgi:tetratricopeptide (TPR) repeat protein